jgi:hypothetical protein
VDDAAGGPCGQDCGEGCRAGGAVGVEAVVRCEHPCARRSRHRDWPSQGTPLVRFLQILLHSMAGLGFFVLT